MKRHIIYFLFILFTGHVSAQWQPINMNSADNYTHISFINDSIGLISTNQVLVLTQNQLNTWDTIYFNTNDYISDVQFINDSTIYFEGYPSLGPGFLKKTFNLGNLWVSANPGNGRIFFTSTSTGYSSTPFTVFKTIDEATNWDGGTAAGSGAPGNIFFFNDNIGYVAANYPGIASVTTNAGSTWQSQSAVEGIDVFAPSANIAYIVGWFGSIQKTTDTGISWNILNSGVPNQIRLNSIHCPDNNTCFVVGDSGTIVRTIDGGITWQPQVSGTTQRLTGVYCIDNNICFVVGDSGIVLKTTSGSVGLQNANSGNIKVYPIPATLEVSIELNNHSADQHTVCIYSVFGQKIKTIDTNGNKININIADLTCGTYFIILNDEHNQQFFTKIIKQ